MILLDKLHGALKLSAKAERIKLREKASDGIWVSLLLPAAVLLSGWKDGDSPLNTPVKIYSLNLLLNYLHLLYHIIFNKSLYVTKSKNILCAISPCITIFFYVNILHLDLRKSLCYTVANTLLYFEGLPFILKVFPNSFTFGEANLAIQGLSLFLFSTLTRLAKVTENGVQNEFETSTTILQIGLIGMLLLCIIPFIFRSMRTPINMYIWIFVVIFGFITYSLNYILTENAFLWLWDFFMRKDRLFILKLWLICITLSVVLIWQRMKVKKKADTAVRKYFHILADIVFITGIFFDTNLIYFASGCVLALFILIEVFRIMKIPPIYESLQNSYELYADEKDCGIVALTPIYLLIGFSLPLWLHPLKIHSDKERVKLLSGVLSVGIGDTCASVLGKAFGRHRWKGSNKTIEGTIACILGQALFAVAVAFLGDIYYSNYDWMKIILAIVIPSVVEAFTDQIDNIVLPLISYILITILNLGFTGFFLIASHFGVRLHYGYKDLRNINN